MLYKEVLVMKMCPNCKEWIGDNADVCFNCNYDYNYRKVISSNTIKQREKQKLVRIEQQIANERQRENLHKNFQLAQDSSLATKIEINDLYEFDVVVIQDKPSGEMDVTTLRMELEKHGREGWDLVNTFTNELGVNTTSIAGFGTNATIEETILIFKRCVKRASRYN